MRKHLVIVLTGLLVLALTPSAPADDRGSGAERYLPRPAGVEKELTFRFGPFLIPPGQDFNRITVDLPIHGGYVTFIAPHLLEAGTGEHADHFDGHIHHAHWFRTSTDPEDEEYTTGLSWVFGTGEETTQADVDARSAADPDGPRYGISIPGGQPQTLIYMLHNKTSQPQLWDVVLDVRFVYGSKDDIAAASDCGPLLLPDEVCAAGQEFRTVRGLLWGRTFDVPRQSSRTRPYVYPGVEMGASNGIIRTAQNSGTIIGGAGHLHPNGMEVVIANLGPAGSDCQADVDGDGFPGTTLFRSQKFDRVAEAFPHSDEYQMGVTRPGFRAPVREGDRIAQWGLYDNGTYASYEAMSYTGIYVDNEAPPPAATGCDLASYAPRLVDDPAGDPTQTILNRAWDEEPHALCGDDFGTPCHRPEQDRGQGLEADTVHIAAFLYLAGDRTLAGPLGAPPRVERGTTMTFVNEDVAAGIRHTVTSCEWPCNGPVTANYPQPDGDFDSRRMGNLDPIDGGGPTSSEAWPEWTLDTTSLEPGPYSYYCRIHPWMRGALEITG